MGLPPIVGTWPQFCIAKKQMITAAKIQNPADSLASLADNERRQLYSILDVWDDEETQVLESVPMAELVNAEQH